MKKFFNMYIDGFKTLSPLGKKLWIIIFIKLFVMFFILKMFFFPNQLNKLKNDNERSSHIIEQLTKPITK